MASFNYGINCGDAKKAQSLYDFIASLNFTQDGLDIDFERVTVISSQALLKELKGYSSKKAGSLKVEVWPADMEYDTAESSGDLETHELAGKVASKAPFREPVNLRPTREARRT